jgi:hypothetical protein
MTMIIKLIQGDLLWQADVDAIAIPVYYPCA